MSFYYLLSSRQWATLSQQCCSLLPEVNRAFNFRIKEYNNFEAGEGKSQLHSHFARISHKIVRWVRLGNDLESGEQVAELIKVECSLLFCCINFPNLNLYILFLSDTYISRTFSALLQAD